MCLNTLHRTQCKISSKWKVAAAVLVVVNYARSNYSYTGKPRLKPGFFDSTQHCFFLKMVPRSPICRVYSLVFRLSPFPSEHYGDHFRILRIKSQQQYQQLLTSRKGNQTLCMSHNTIHKVVLCSLPSNEILIDLLHQIVNLQGTIYGQHSNILL